MIDRRIWPVAALAALLGLLPSAGGAQSAPAPYEINAILPLTGLAAFFGESSAKTMKLVEERVNAEGGIHGRPIRMVIADDQSNPQVAVQLANALIAKKAPVILGPGLTSTCAAVAPLVAAAGPLMFCISPYITPGGYVYVSAGSAIDNAVVVLRYYRERGIKRFAMLNSTDASGQALDRAFEDAFRLHENRDVQLVAHQHFGPTDQSVAAQMSQIKTAAPQVLISWTVGAPFATVVRGQHDSGMDVPLVTSGANMTSAQMTQLVNFVPKELDFLTIPVAVRGSTVAPRIAQAQRAFFAMFDAAKIKPDGGYANAYDMTILTVDALRHVSADPTAEQLHAYFGRLHDYAGANAIYDFRFSERGSGQNGFELARYNAPANGFEPISKPGGWPLAPAR